MYLIGNYAYNTYIHHSAPPRVCNTRTSYFWCIWVYMTNPSWKGENFPDQISHVKNRMLKQYNFVQNQRPTRDRVRPFPRALTTRETSHTKTKSVLSKHTELRATASVTGEARRATILTPFRRGHAMFGVEKC